jgi:hypothetical protein
LGEGYFMDASECFIMTGKLGDCVNVLPLLKLQWIKTGEPTKLIVSKRYASIVEGLDYVEPIVFDGEFDELERAVTEAKQQFKRVIPLQVYGKNFPFDHRHHSFAIDQWARAGMAHLWGGQDLDVGAVGDSICKSDLGKLKGAILVADKSESSPFPHVEKLITRLKAEFQERQIVRLSEIKLPRFRDMVGVYDSAALLIATETAHLHLSAASQTPTIALATDKPSVWHGTAQRPGLAFHCRYSDYGFREDELFRVVHRIVNNLGTTDVRHIQTTHPHGYNMGMLDVNNSTLLSYRYHPDPKNWKTKLAIVDGSKTGELVVPGVEDKSLEDARLFMFRGKPHIAYTVSDAIGGLFRSVQAYGELEKSDDGWRVKNHTVIKRAGNDFSRMEKNWTAFVSGDRLNFIYGIVGKNQIVLEVDGARVVKEYTSPAPEWKWGQIRGGVVAGGYPLLRLFHSRVGDGIKHFTFRYYIGASLMNPEPPFETEAVSKFPVYAGHEEWTPNCPHWKPNCALIYGAKITDGGIAMSVGINDCRSAIIRLKMEDLFL